jgi:hypothetical protein
MTLLDAKTPKPKTGIFKYIPLWLLIVIIAIIAGTLIYSFRNYPEEHAVTRFLTTLENGKYPQAYKLWQPASSYAFNDFMQDWGPEGDYGKITSFKIVQVKSEGSETVEVWVRINHREPPLGLLVDRGTKGLAYAFSS